ncbi:PREDICTED: melatonin receptor type 1A-like isoform X1 [Acropora digitifera]|uniref:melatonin receptor type 1A-like isoform X1 n=2 Tax=Acropora digitifera TaxID=70779 RepID=UPI00077A97D5|nr:PREDICTED: melatonin receptor type 1A-like isoform X1 [Acropora digitifera]
MKINFVHSLLKTEMTGNSNLSNQDDPTTDTLGRSEAQMWLEISLAILICLVAFTGNVLVVIAIHSDQRLNNITNMLIENLAFTDIFMASLHMPFWIISLRYGRWVFGHAVCQLVGLTQLLFGICSLFTMTGIAFNRYFNIVRRNLYLKYFSTKKTTYILIIISWLGPLSVTSPQLYGWGKIEYHVLFADCTCVWDLPDISYIIFLCFTTIFAAAAFMSWCYYTIYKTVKASAQRMQGHAAKSNVKSNTTGATKSDRTEKKVLKTSFVVVVVYMTCWTPLSVIGFIEVFGSSSPRWAHIFAYYFVFCSSLTNPFIYGIMNPQFQSAFKKMLRIGRNEVQPLSSVGRGKGGDGSNATKSTGVDVVCTIENMPSTSTQSEPVFRNHNATKSNDATVQPQIPAIQKSQAWS